jgi:hypothetical protein
MLISNEKTSTTNVIADFCHRICAEALDPEKGVVDTSPRQGAAGTTAFDRLQPLLMRHLPCSRLVVECGRAWTALTSSQLRPQERRYPP